MGWFTRFTRFGDAHLVFGQEAENSCGIACVRMCVFKVNKIEPGKTALQTEQQIYKVYSQASGRNYDGSTYTFANILADTLNKLNCGTWAADFVGAAGVSDAIIASVGTDIVGLGPAINSFRRGYPIIVLVGWGRGGAHFVVVDTVNSFFGSLYASVCDPWDGDVHITSFKPGQAFNYIASSNPSSWSIGSHHEYKQQAAGQTNGWIVRRTN